MGGAVLEHVLGKMLKLWLWTEIIRGMREEGKAYNRHLLSQGRQAQCYYSGWQLLALEIREITILLLEDTSMFVSRLRKLRLSHVRVRVHVCQKCLLIQRIYLKLVKQSFSTNSSELTVLLSRMWPPFSGYLSDPVLSSSDSQVPSARA